MGGLFVVERRQYCVSVAYLSKVVCFKGNSKMSE